MKSLLEAQAASWAVTPADSARIVENVYTASILIILPAVLAILALLLLRRASAGTRTLIWRSAAVSLLAIYTGTLLPATSLAWVVPDALAAPLVLLGRIQVSALTGPGENSGDPALATAGYLEEPAAVILFLCYCFGIFLVALPTARAWLNTVIRTRHAKEISHGSWHRILEQEIRHLGLRRPIRLLVSKDTSVPLTWGVMRPVILIPSGSMSVSAEQKRGLLIHELEHIRSFDWLFGLIARAVCALYWFHPAAWWILRGLRSECEVACDDRVMISGVRPSEYAELLIRTSDHAGRGEVRGSFAPALSVAHRGDLRGRLRLLMLPARARRAPRILSVLATAAASAMIALPAGMINLAPGRTILNVLMEDARWESRAYAVHGLAQRSDSVRLAEAAAVDDPNPHVRAHARAALERSRPSPAPLINERQHAR